MHDERRVNTGSYCHKDNRMVISSQIAPRSTHAPPTTTDVTHVLIGQRSGVSSREGPSKKSPSQDRRAGRLGRWYCCHTAATIGGIVRDQAEPRGTHTAALDPSCQIRGASVIDGLASSVIAPR
jgi:hypothetical protein